MRKPRRWIERMQLRCADRDAQIVGERFDFDVYRRYVLGQLTALEIVDVLGYMRGIWLRGSPELTKTIAEHWI